MPHAELRYSDDLKIDAVRLLQEIEATILRHDAEAGECKGRAYPAVLFHHSHLLATVSLLAKPHRNTAFIAALSDDLERTIKAAIPQSCFFSLDIRFGSQIYVTNRHEGAG